MLKVPRTHSICLLTEKYAIYRLPLKMVGSYLISYGYTWKVRYLEMGVLWETRGSLSLSTHGKQQRCVADMHVP